MLISGVCTVAYICYIHMFKGGSKWNIDLLCMWIIDIRNNSLRRSNTRQCITTDPNPCDYHFIAIFIACMRNIKECLYVFLCIGNLISHLLIYLYLKKYLQPTNQHLYAAEVTERVQDVGFPPITTKPFPNFVKHISIAI